LTLKPDREAKTLQPEETRQREKERTKNKKGCCPTTIKKCQQMRVPSIISYYDGTQSNYTNIHLPPPQGFTTHPKLPLNLMTSAFSLPNFPNSISKQVRSLLLIPSNMHLTDSYQTQNPHPSIPTHEEEP
jgi:hypothetical protein